jgi:hypothetical protein
MEALEARQLLSGAPTVSIALFDAWASETGANPGVFRISRVGGPKAALAVKYSLAGSTAANGVDYTAISWTQVTIPTNATYVDARITIKNDLLVEGTENVVMTLLASATYKLGTAKTATVKIADNDYTIGDYFPLGTGSIWNYSGTQDGFDQADRTTSVPTIFGGVNTYARRFYVDGQLNQTQYQGIAPDGRLVRVGEVTSTATRTFTTPMVVSPAVLEVGRSNAYSIAYTGTASGTQAGTTKLIALETITVNGTVYSALRLQDTGSWSETATKHGTWTQTLWLVKGVGEVKETYAATETAGASTMSYYITKDLTDYVL